MTATIHDAPLLPRSAAYPPTAAGRDFGRSFEEERQEALTSLYQSAAEDPFDPDLHTARLRLLRHLTRLG